MPSRDDIPLDDRLPGGSHAPRAIVRRAPGATGPVENYNPANDADDEGPSAADLERFSDVTVRCPNCSTELMDDVAICYKCGHALGDPNEPRTNSRWWIWATAALLLAIMGYAIFRNVI